MKNRKQLPEYISIVLPRDGVQLVIAWLEAVGPTRGPLRWLHAQLGQSMDRDGPRRSIGRINTVIGELEIDELFEVVVKVLELEARGELEGDRRTAVAEVLARIRDAG